MFIVAFGFGGFAKRTGAIAGGDADGHCSRGGKAAAEAGWWVWSGCEQGMCHVLRESEAGSVRWMRARGRVRAVPSTTAEFTRTAVSYVWRACRCGGRSG